MSLSWAGKVGSLAEPVAVVVGKQFGVGWHWVQALSRIQEGKQVLTSLPDRCKVQSSPSVLSPNFRDPSMCIFLAHQGRLAPFVMVMYHSPLLSTNVVPCGNANFDSSWNASG